METAPEQTDTCIRCGDVESPDADGYCNACLLESRAEVSVGMRRLAEYLASWAAFDEWLESRGADPATA